VCVLGSLCKLAFSAGLVPVFVVGWQSLFSSRVGPRIWPTAASGSKVDHRPGISTDARLYVINDRPVSRLAARARLPALKVGSRLRLNRRAAAMVGPCGVVAPVLDVLLLLVLIQNGGEASKPAGTRSLGLFELFFKRQDFARLTRGSRCPRNPSRVTLALSLLMIPLSPAPIKVVTVLRQDVTGAPPVARFFKPCDGLVMSLAVPVAVCW